MRKVSAINRDGEEGSMTDGSGTVPSPSNKLKESE